jgi:hypothetical protein
MWLARVPGGNLDMKAAVRPRQMTPGQERRLDALRGVSQLLDSAFAIPGTSYRIGLDPIVGLVPWLGDLVSPIFTIAILWQARDLGLPRIVQIRMLINAAIDTLVGMIPLAGDLFDFAWKSNQMNMALLERYAYEERRPAAADWIFVAAIIVILVAIAAVPFLLAGWLLSVIGRQL